MGFTEQNNINMGQVIEATSSELSEKIIDSLEECSNIFNDAVDYTTWFFFIGSITKVRQEVNVVNTFDRSLISEIEWGK